MSIKKNIFSGYIVEFHILQSFPVTCLNRDENGAPKTAEIGGTTRARVSSQCWKRPVRQGLEGFVLGKRTKLIAALLREECLKQGATEDQAIACSQKVESIFIKKDESKETEESEDKSDTLIFISPSEVSKIVTKFKDNGWDAGAVIKQKDAKKAAKEIADIIGKPNFAIDGVDIALFGRMVAQASTLDVEGAVSFNHAISTHRVTNELEFFTAMDDENDQQGSAHMGSLEYNSATYYRYVSIDLGQLYENMAGVSTPEAVESFIRSLYQSVPSARQASQSGASPWEFARVYIRKGQRLQVPFETSIKAKDGGFIQPSLQYLKEYTDKKEKLSGSLFGKVLSKDFGEDENYNIDCLIKDITDFMKGKINEN